MEILTSLPTSEMALLALGVGMAGLLAGVIAGLLGVGGGIVLVPVLFQAFSLIGVPASLCMPFTRAHAHRLHDAAGSAVGSHRRH